MMQSEEKLCVVVLFGGMSSEHEVSCVSAGTFVDNLDPSRYEVLTVGITKEGRWLCTEASSAQMADGSWEELPGNMPCVITYPPGGEPPVPYRSVALLVRSQTYPGRTGGEPQAGRNRQIGRAHV